MKWKNKGHEFDATVCSLKTSPIFIFGAGVGGQQLYEEFKEHIQIKGFIDNSIQKQRDGCLGLPVYSAINFKKMLSDDVIVIISAYNKESVDNIIMQLEDYGLKRNINLFAREIYDIFQVYIKQKLFIKKCSLLLTEHCNLNCRHCSVFVPHIKTPKHMDFSILKKDVDLFFSAIDYIYYFHLAGAEPFLYPRLSEIIAYISENYKNKLGKLRIFTNGTITPNDEILEVIKKYNVSVHISDYSHFLPHIKENVYKFINRLSECGVEYEFVKIDNWFDYGFEAVSSDSVLSEKHEGINGIDFFCNPQCRCVLNGKFYYCPHDAIAFKNGFVNEDSGLDLTNIKPEDKPVLYEYDIGFSDKGYVELCRKCNGYPPQNQNFILVAEQVNKQIG